MRCPSKKAYAYCYVFVNHFSQQAQQVVLFNTVHVIRVGMAASLTEAVIDKMKAEDGAIKSAWKWLRDKNIEHLDIFVEATATGRREWTYRTQHVQHPDEGVTHAIFLALGGKTRLCRASVTCCMRQNVPIACSCRRGLTFCKTVSTTVSAWQELK